jgi:tape measure domain-containing protein
MRFDNKQFESNVSTTMSTLEKLKQSLSLKGASKAAESEFASYKAGFTGLTQFVKDSYNRMWSSIEHTTGQKMKQLLTSFTIDPIKTGFSEYETQINAIQTILANTESKGTTLEDVNGALDELNTYADKTIYNFTEMTRNIGTFTAAGTDLETSVNAIKGIANLAAVSGSTSQQASTAMYQLSQAMASGTVKLMDWNSVVNAGMGGQVFQDALKETARVHGVAIDDIISKNGSFRESLSEGWLTTEILTDTLEKFTMYAEEGSKEWEAYKKTLIEKGYTEAQAEEILKMGKTATEAATKVKTFTQLFDTLKEAAQSGWTQTWEILVGDFEEAKELLTNISDVVGGFINQMSESRNELLENWKVMGGRDDLLESFVNIWEGLLSVIKPIKDAFTEIFPPATAEQLFKITESLKNFTAKLKLSDKSADRLKRTFKGIFAVVDIFRIVIVEALKAIGSLFGGVGELSGGLLGFTAGLGDLLVAFRDFIEYSGVFNKVFQGIAFVVKFVLKIISTLVNFIADGFSSPVLQGFVNFLEDIAASMFTVEESSTSMKDAISSAFSSMGEALQKSPIIKFFSSLIKGVSKVASALFNFGKVLVGGFIDKLANANFETALEILNGLVTGGLAIGLGKLIFSLAGSVKSFRGIIDGISEVIEGFKEKLSGGDSTSVIDTIRSLAISILILTASLVILSLVDSEKLSYGIAMITALFADLVASMALLNKTKGLTGSMTKVGTAMIMMSVSVLLLASALKKIGSLDQESMINGLIGVSGLLIALSVSVQILTKSTRKVKKGTATTLIAISLAMLILASAVKRLSEMSWEDLGKAGVTLAGLVGAFTLLALASKLVTPKKLAKIGGSLMAIGLALMLLVPSIKRLASMSWEELAKAGVAIYGLVGAFTLLALSSKLITPKKLAELGGALTVLAASLLIFTISIAALSAISWEGLAKAGTAILGLVGALAILSAMFSSKNKSKMQPATLLKVATALTILGAALLIFTISIAALSAISWEGLAKAGVAILGLVGAFTLLSLVFKRIDPFTILNIGTAIVTLGAALLIFTIGIAALSAISWEGLAKAGVAIYGLVGAFTLLALASKLIDPLMLIVLTTSIMYLSQSLLVMSAAFRVLGGMSWSSLAISLVAIAGAITIFAVAALLCKPLVPTMIALSVAILTVSLGLLAFSGALLIAALALPLLGAGLLAFSATIMPAIGIIIEGLGLLLVGIVNIVGDLIVALCKVIIDAAPAIGLAIAALIKMICAAIYLSLPEISKLLIVLITEVCKVLVECIPIITEAIFKLIVSVLNQLTKYVPIIVGAVFDLLLAVLDGIATNIPKLVSGVIDILAKLFQEVLNVLSSVDPSVLIEGLLAVGLMAGIMAALAAVSSLVPAAMLGVLGMGVVATELALVLAAIGQLTKIPGLMDAIGNGGEFLQAIGTAIGKFVGGIAEGFTDSLPAVGTNLTGFMTNAKGFFDGLNDINESTLQSALSLVKVILAITAANIIEGIASWITGESSVSQFATDIVTLGVGLKGFSDAVTGVNPEAVSAAANAAKTLAEMTEHIPNSGGVVSWFAGDNSISKFASEIPQLGKALKGFADNVSGISPEQVTAAANAAKTLAEMTAIIPNSGGVVSWFAGDNSIANFSSELTMLGSAIKGFSDKSTGIKPDEVMAAANAAKTLAEMTNAIPNQGGVVAWFTGESSISKYAGQLPSLGRGLKGFASQVNGIDPEAVTAAANAANALAEMTQHIPTEGGIKAWFTGESSVSKFADKLPTLGGGLKSFSSSVAGINPENITAAADAAKSLAEMTATVPKDTSKITTFGTNLESFGTKLASYFSKTSKITKETASASSNAINAVKEISEVDANKVKSVGDAIDDVTKALKNLSKVPGDMLGTFKKDLKTLGETGAKAFSKEFEDLDKDMETAGEDAMNSFKKGAEGKKKSVTDAFKKIADACAEALSNKKASFESAGKSLAQGFADGIGANTFKATAKAKAMAEAAEKAAREELDINSPSKVFMDIGGGVPEGFAMGVDKLGGLVKKSVEGMSTRSIDGVKRGISRIADMINGDIDVQPTIRPVLDLSDVKNGASAISGMLGSTASMGVLANVGAINSIMAARSQNGANDDVVSAIDRLNKNLENAGDTYNFGNITAGDDSAIAEAVQALIRAALMERRV